MFIGKTLPFIRGFVDELDRALRRMTPEAGLTRIQKGWLGFCLLAIVVTNSVCWKRFERASLGLWPHVNLSWMFRSPNCFWSWILRASVSVIIHKYGITEGMLVVDDGEKQRSKRTKRIYKTHTLKEKKTGGFINGQSFVFLLLVTPKVTIPVGVEFYMPDPVLSAWNKEDKRLRKQGVAKSKRPAKPKKNPLYPTKPEIALGLLEEFRPAFVQLAIKCILADSLYGSEAFVDKASALFGGIQVISQLRKNQKVRFQGKTLHVSTFFRRYPGVKHTIRIRGGVEITVFVSSARLWVCVHGKKRFVIALKYEGENEYRYLVASDMSWRTLDIVQAQTFRWLVEVFFQDWKAYEGWGQLTKQPDEEGSRRSLILSLLCDHCLLLHPDQLARIEGNLPACTVGSLRDRVTVESLVQFFQEVVSSENPQEQLEEVAKHAKECDVQAYDWARFRSIRTNSRFGISSKNCYEGCISKNLNIEYNHAWVSIGNTGVIRGSIENATIVFLLPTPHPSQEGNLVASPRKPYPELTLWRVQTLVQGLNQAFEPMMSSCKR